MLELHFSSWPLQNRSLKAPSLLSLTVSSVIREQEPSCRKYSNKIISYGFQKTFSKIYCLLHLLWTGSYPEKAL